jgi:hypothetical protein
LAAQIKNVVVVTGRTRTPKPLIPRESYMSETLKTPKITARRSPTPEISRDHYMMILAPYSIFQPSTAAYGFNVWESVLLRRSWPARRVPKAREDPYPVRAIVYSMLSGFARLSLPVGASLRIQHPDPRARWQAVRCGVSAGAGTGGTPRNARVVGRV